MKKYSSVCFFTALLTAFLLSGCYTREEPVMLESPFGEIEKGSSMAGVMGVLGNPHDISPQGEEVIWLYRFEDKHYFVYFVNDRLVNIVDK